VSSPYVRSVQELIETRDLAHKHQDHNSFTDYNNFVMLILIYMIQSFLDHSWQDQEVGRKQVPESL
jgi:hypothetical protein